MTGLSVLLIKVEMGQQEQTQVTVVVTTVKLQVV
jgi:hypothetical protein